MTKTERLRLIRKERKAILKMIESEINPIYARYKPALDANQKRIDYLLAEIEKDWKDKTLIRDLPF